jgi:hypothetical protein
MRRHPWRWIPLALGGLIGALDAWLALSGHVLAAGMFDLIIALVFPDQ